MGHCQMCVSTKRWLDKKGLDYIELNLYAEENATVLKVAKERGMAAAPIVSVNDSETSLETEMWCGYRPDLLGGLVTT